MPKIADRLREVRPSPESVEIKQAQVPPATQPPKKVGPKRKKADVSENTPVTASSIAITIEVPASWIEIVQNVAETYGTTPNEILKKIATKQAAGLRQRAAKGRFEDLKPIDQALLKTTEKIDCRAWMTTDQYEAISSYVDPLDLNTKKQNIAEIYRRLMHKEIAELTEKS